jgi:selenocysteine-specific elongation factor
VAIAGAREGAAGPSEVAPGASAYARIRLEAPAVLTRGDRFIVRAYSPAVTIGGGLVLDPHPPRGAIRTAGGLARFRALDGGSAVDAAAAFVRERAGYGLPVAALVSRAGLSPELAAATARELADTGRAVTIGDLLVASSEVASLAERLIESLRAHHAAEPLSEGLPREEARGRIFNRAAPDVFEYVVERLVSARRIVARDRLALEGHQLSLTPDEARARQAIERVFLEARLAPPDPASVAAAVATTPAIADRIVKLLLRQKTLVKLDALMFHADALVALKADVRGLKTAGQEARVDVAAFKERYGVSRKYAIPLLEYLDRERVTRRMGDARVIL